ncbi:MAG: TIGR03557 family F420-dependent LLM class oxidoreductase [Dehalococcoidia bacterium]
MVELGYHVSSEEHGPNDLICYAQRAEQSGFGFALISDHYHPWIDRQGHSPFVWAVIGAIAQATERLRLGTAVTCPILRLHPAIVAQAAATAAALLPGRFFLGVGTGENLNEHVLGQHWPPADVRREMLEDAVTILRLLWRGGTQSHRGRYFTVEEACIYTLPDEPPPIYVAAGGRGGATFAGRIGDGLISVVPKADVIEAFAAAGGAGKPRYAQVHVCWAEDEATARRTAHEWWPVAGLEGAPITELRLPRHFEQAVKPVREEDVAERVVCGPDPARHLAAIRTFADAGYDHVAVHQIGPDQEGFFRFYEREILPQFAQSSRHPTRTGKGTNDGNDRG